MARPTHMLTTALVLAVFSVAPSAPGDEPVEGGTKALLINPISCRDALDRADAKSDPACCDPCCCDAESKYGCNNVCPCWTVTAGGLVLQRSAPDAMVLASNQADPTEALNASQFDFGLHGGYEIGLTRHDVLSGCDVEAKFFAIDGWSQGATTLTSGPPQIHFRPLPLDIPAARDITSRYASELTSLEINLRRQVACLPACHWLIGFRYLELDEGLGMTFTDPAALEPTVAYDVNVRNRLYGFQIGGDLTLLTGCRWDVAGFLKAGIYGNAADHAGVLTSPPNTVLYGSPGNATAFVGETGISAGYRLCGSLALRADYRVVWVDGVALASDQIAATNSLTFQGIDRTGGAFYHGVFVGLDGSF